MAQTTAVEWFWIHLPENISKEYFDLFEQAKAMEKKQIMKAVYDTMEFDPNIEIAEKYYNETYNL